MSWVPGLESPVSACLSHVCRRSACLGLGVGVPDKGCPPSWEFGVVAECQQPVAFTGGGETMAGRSNSGSRQTMWRRWSAQQSWNLRGR